MRAIWLIVLTCLFVSSCGGGSGGEPMPSATPLVSSWFDANDSGRKTLFQQDVTQAFLTQRLYGAGRSSGTEISICNSFSSTTNSLVQSALIYTRSLTKNYSLNKAEIKAIFQRWNDADNLYIDTKIKSFGVSGSFITQLKSNVNNTYIAAMLAVDAM